MTPPAVASRDATLPPLGVVSRYALRRHRQRHRRLRHHHQLSRRLCAPLARSSGSSLEPISADNGFRDRLRHRPHIPSTLRHVTAGGKRPARAPNSFEPRRAHKRHPRTDPDVNGQWTFAVLRSNTVCGAQKQQRGVDGSACVGLAVGILEDCHEPVASCLTHVAASLADTVEETLRSNARSASSAFLAAVARSCRRSP